MPQKPSIITALEVLSLLPTSYTLLQPFSGDANPYFHQTKYLNFLKNTIIYNSQSLVRCTDMYPTRHYIVPSRNITFLFAPGFTLANFVHGFQFICLGRTNLDGALTDIKDIIFQTANGDRSLVRNVLLIVTDGKPTDSLNANLENTVSHFQFYATSPRSYATSLPVLRDVTSGLTRRHVWPSIYHQLT